MLLDDGQSVAAFFELAPLGTEGRELAWLLQARDALENALEDSFDELDRLDLRSRLVPARQLTLAL